MRAYACCSWIIKVFALLVLMMVSIGLFNLIVDPYDIYRLVRVPGVNANKSMAVHQERLAKPLQVRLLKPRGIILGSSRAAVGIDPQHPGWDPLAVPVFNYALTSATIDELVSSLEQALTVSTPRQVVIDLDFFMFNAYLNRNPLIKPDDSSSLPWLRTLFTGTALADSYNTLLKQDPNDRPGVLANGQIGRTFNLRRVSKYGHHHGFETYERLFFEGSLFPLPAKEYSLEEPTTKWRSMDSFRRLLEVARQADIDLRIFISPVHVRLLEVYSQSNLWVTYEEWKRQLVYVIEENNKNYSSHPPFLLWDFSGVNSITSEVVPPPEDTRTTMSWYWEASHYKAETGDLILDRIFNYNRAGDVVPADFGVLLTAANIEQHLAKTQSSMKRWRMADPKAAAEVKEIGRESGWRKGKYRL